MPAGRPARMAARRGRLMRRPLPAVVLAAMAMHALVLWLAWRTGLLHLVGPGAMPRTSMVMVVPVPAASVPQSRQQAGTAAARTAVVPPAKPLVSAPLNALSAAPVIEPAPEAVPAQQAAGTALPGMAETTPPASASSAPFLLDAEVARRAIRGLARKRSTAELAMENLNQPARAAPGARMAAGIGEAARGDCAKGDFKGGGMGLLSLPFLAAAALQGECAR